MTAPPALAAYAAREDLHSYGSNGLMLFALQLQLRLEDIHSVAATALTDGANDKKCDLVYVDREAARIVVAQGYYSQSATAASAPANKASDLNTAVTWLLTGDLLGLPSSLQSAAAEVRDALNQGDIREFDLWYSHNLPESQNVQDELNQAARTAKGLISSYFPNAPVSSVIGHEIGQRGLEELYRRTEVPIVVTETYEVSIPGGFEVQSARWKAYTTAIPGAWLRELWQSHESDLMSPNVRDYLGIVRSDRNINNNIKTTATQSPEQFWIYNNGLTILVNDYHVSRGRKGRHTLKIHGVGIVNGAQTTGSVGTLSDTDAANLSSMTVMARFVKCDDPDVLAEIVKYNNSQNKVEAADFRSKDRFQDRLRSEFEGIREADYRGGRRGGTRDAIERSKFLLPDGTVAQALAAFHGRPNLAYNETRRIWVEDDVYSQLYSDRTTARHVVFAYSLLRAVESAKKELVDRPAGERTGPQEAHLQYFRRRGSIQLLVAAMADSLETILGSAVPDRFSLQFRMNCSPRDASVMWSPIVTACLPFSRHLIEAVDSSLRSSEKVAEAIRNFQGMIESTVEPNSARYEQFADRVESVSASFST